MNTTYQVQGTRIIKRAILRETATNLWLSGPHTPDGERTMRKGSRTFPTFDEAKACAVEMETYQVESRRKQLETAEKRLASVCALTIKDAQDYTTPAPAHPSTIAL